MKTKNKILHTLAVGVIVALIFLIFPLPQIQSDYIGPENVREIEYQKENESPPYQGLVLVVGVLYLFIVWFAAGQETKKRPS